MTEYTEKTLSIDGVKITIRRPVLTPEERRASEKKIISALIKFDRALTERSAANV